MVFYFSGTGNTKWIANQIADFQNERLVNIANELVNSGDILQYDLEEEELIGFISPVYSWAPPKIVLDFIQKINFSNYKNHYLFFVCSCGDDIGLTKDIFLKTIHQKGWECRAGFSVQMPNNYVLLKGFDTDPKEVEKKKLSQAIPEMERINKLISKRVEEEYNCKEGRFPFIKTHIINPLFNKYAITAKPFYATSDCIFCKLCEKVCPTANVTVNLKPVWGNNCTSCLACFHICPQHAIHYGKATRHKGHYFNPNVRPTD